MAGFLRKLFDQANPFDNGKSFSNQNPQPASTARPSIVNQVGSALPVVGGFFQANNRQNQAQDQAKQLWQQASANNVSSVATPQDQGIKPVDVTSPLKTIGKGFWETGDIVRNQARANIAGLTGNKVAEQNANQDLSQSFHQSIPGMMYDPAKQAVTNSLVNYPKAYLQGAGQAFGTGTQGSFADKFSRIDANAQNKLRQQGLSGDYAREAAIPALVTATNVLGLGETGFAANRFAQNLPAKGFQGALRAEAPAVANTTALNTLQGVAQTYQDPNATVGDALKAGATNAVVGTAGDIALGAGALAFGKGAKVTTGLVSDATRQVVEKNANAVRALAPDFGADISGIAPGQRGSIGKGLHPDEYGTLGDYADFGNGQSVAGNKQALIRDAQSIAQRNNLPWVPGDNLTNAKVVGDFLNTQPLPGVVPRGQGGSISAGGNAPISGPNLNQAKPKTPPTPPELGQLPKVPSDLSSTPSIPPVASDVANILQGQKVKDRGFAATVANAEKTPKMDAIDNGAYVVKSDKQRVADARQYIKDNPAKAEQVALNPQSDMHVTIGNQLLDHYIATGQIDKFRTLTSGMAASGTELGRAIHSFADYNKTTPAGAVKFAEKTIQQYNKLNPKKQLNLSNEDVQGLITKAQEVQAMPEGRQRNIASQQLMTQVNDLIPSTIADKAITVWKAGLLTSPRTTMRNLIGNTLHGITETVKDVPAALNDILLKQKTGERTLTPTVRGTVSGTVAGLKSGKDMMQFGFDPTHAIDKYDIKHVTWGPSKTQQALKKYTNFVFDAMGAQDQPFYHAAFARSLYDQAGAAAKNAGKSGDRAFIEGLVKKPTEAMTVAATKDASVATFKDPNALRDVAGKFKQTLGKTEAGKIVSEVVAPFTGVPSSIAGQMAAYSPIGLAKGIAKDAKVLSGKVKPADVPALQRQASQEIGRGVVGTGILGIGAYLTAQGLMTGNPKDANEARQWQLEGRQANSVMINGKWRSINSIGPEALVALAGSKIQAGAANHEGAGKVAGNLGKDFTSQTFLAGVQGPLNAVSDPARYGGTYEKSQAASVVPNIVKDTAKAFDPTQRETNTVKEALQAGIPGLRNNLLPKRDALGNPLKQEPSGAGAFIDLFNSKAPIKNDVVNELSRLYSQDQSATPSKLNAKQKLLGQDVKLSPQQLDQLEQQTGEPIKQQFSQLMGTPEYQKASDEMKKKALDGIVSNVRESAKLNTARSLLTPDQLNSDSVKKAEHKAQVDVTKLTSDAQMTLAKDSFDKSGKSYQVVGDTVLRRSADGTVSATPKTKFDYQVGTATLTRQKSAGDVKGWVDTANKQLDSINKQLQDPSIDPLDAITLQNDAQALQNNIDKYKSYGGFTKPKKAKTGKAKSPGGFDYTKSVSGTTGASNQTALRALVKRSTIKRKVIKA